MNDKYSLRSKQSLATEDDEALLQRLLERMFTSDSFLDKLCSKISDRILPELKQSSKVLVEKVSVLENKIADLQSEINQLQQYSRKKNIRIYGVKESKSEDTEAVVAKLFEEKLGVTVLPTDIDITHRLRQKEDGIKPIIVRFTNRKIKNIIYKNKSKLKGSRIVVKEDLTHQNAELYKQASKILGYKSVWSSDCCIYGKVNGKIHIINSLEAIENIRERVIPFDQR